MRYSLQEIEVDKFLCIDTETNVSCEFLIHQFNETQVFNTKEERKDLNPIDKSSYYAKIASAMGDWLVKNHPEIIF